MRSSRKGSECRTAAAPQRLAGARGQRCHVCEPGMRGGPWGEGDTANLPDCTSTSRHQHKQAPAQGSPHKRGQLSQLPTCVWLRCLEGSDTPPGPTSTAAAAVRAIGPLCLSSMRTRRRDSTHREWLLPLPLPISSPCAGEGGGERANASVSPADAACAASISQRQQAPAATESWAAAAPADCPWTRLLPNQPAR